MADESIQDILAQLERTLATVAETGAPFVNVPPDPSLVTLLERAGREMLAPAPQAAPAATVAQNAPPETPPAPEPSRRGPPPAPASAAQATAAPAPAAPPRPAAAGPSRPLAEIATLESLKFQFRNCQACGLAESRNRLVFGVGNPRPPLLFIGEGPGADEDAQGLPFVGRAGALLTGLILASGLTREDVYITNMVKCRPPGNRNPEPPELDACRPILERQIELLQPRLIVTLGNVPLKALNPSAAGITRERGRVFQYRDWPVLPTYHPSYLLRNRAALPDCWQDFRQALALAYPAQ